MAALNAQDRAAAEVAQRDAQNRLSSFVDGSGKGVSHLTRAEQEAKQLKDVQTQFETATKGFNQSSAEYLRAYDVFKAREQEIRDRFAKPAQRQAAAQLQNELGAQLAVWKGVAENTVETVNLKDTDTDIKTAKDAQKLIKGNASYATIEFNKNNIVGLVTLTGDPSTWIVSSL